MSDVQIDGDGIHALYRPWSCTHEEYPQEVRYKIDRLGRKSFVRQCMKCGRTSSAALKWSAVENRDSVLPFDESILKDAQALVQAHFESARERAREAWQEREEQVQADREARDDEWWEIYNEYLATAEWKRKSRAVCKRDGMCRACGGRPATQAHHLTYKHAFNEPLFDLVGVCGICHPKITEMDRERRYTTGIEDARAWREAQS